MIVETNNGLRSPARTQASRILVTADDGTPIALIVQFAGGKQPWFRCFRAGDKDFEEQLRMHGVKNTVTVARLDAGLTKRT